MDFTGCGWFGIQTWIGGAAIYNFIAIFLRKFFRPFCSTTLSNALVAVIKSAPSMGEFQGINVAEFFCFWIFWIANMAIVFFGPGMSLTVFNSPFIETLITLEQRKLRF